MKAVFLKGSPPAGRDPLCNRAAAAVMARAHALSWEVKAFALATMNIKACRGCFSCWTRTPGRCIIADDDQEAVLRAWAGAERIILLTPLTFGGYSPELKKALDRAIPALLPFFIRINGETHHPQRYPRPRRLLAIGTLKGPDSESEEVFRDLVGRNALNMSDGEATTMVFSGDVPLSEMEKRLGTEPFFGGTAQ
ncbi:MAG: flavodoxin family protein [Candidatus Aminicenantes bacterium]|nr:flavodoxin family protein [Candidatus Aminicenantes bacterium]